MRIGFDTSVLARPCPRGVARVARGLVAALERRGRLEIVRLTPAPCERVSLWRQFALPRRATELELRGIHSPVSAFPIFGRGARVATIHEIPWARGVSENSDARHKLWARVGPLRADAILTPSATTAALVRDESALAAQRVHIAPWGVDASFSPAVTPSDEGILARHGLSNRDFVLASGATRPKKHPAAGMAALQRTRTDMLLVATGAITEHILRELARFPSIASRVRLLGEVDDATLSVLNRHAQAVLVLSDSEGFGLPVVEAQASGTPVITARGTAQSEIAGAAGLQVDPTDAAEVAHAIDESMTRRVQLAADGYANAARFTWDACAERVEHVWRSLA
ncbi:MAG: glycosyltransferase family 4 protein [Planctomycetes bacterium]|nr:glycosyltransferase family 4 protein [Planctomycetota bacterium]